MSAVEWLLWFAIAWGVFLIYCAINLPALCARAALILAALIRHGDAR